MLASPADGEALNAARALGRTLSGVGLDLNDLANVIEQPPALPPVRRTRRTKAQEGHINWPVAYRAQVATTLEKGLIRFPFNSWERDFITNIIGRLHNPHGRLTFKQAEVAERLVAKVEHGR
jgi:hypothetical protein